MRADLAEQTAILRAQRAHLRLDLIGRERARVGDKMHVFDIQFIANQCGERGIQLRTLYIQRAQRLTNLDVRGIAAGAAQLNDVHNLFHRSFELGIDSALVAAREVAQMHGILRAGEIADDQILIHRFRHERNVRRAELRKRDQHSVQRVIRRLLVARPFASPEALLAQADVPVRQLVHEILNRAGGFGDLQLRQTFVDEFHQRIQLRKRPFVHQRVVAFLGAINLRLVIIDRRVHGEERVGIPERAHEFALHFADEIAGEARRQPRGARRIEVPANRVRALLVQHVPRIDDVAEMLAHLRAFRVLNMAHDEAVLERRAVEDQR